MASACGAGEGATAQVRPGGLERATQVSWLPRGPADTEDFGCTPPTGTVLASSLAAPRFKPDSPWHPFAPWAFWLVDAAEPRLLVELGVGGGFSLMAFAEAATELALPTRLVGVDRWSDDPADGAADARALRPLLTCIGRHYATNTEIWQMAAQEAALRMGEREVDLLHIDGARPRAAIQEDLTSWLPRMSRRGVVVLSAIDDRRPGAEAWQLWGELAAAHPAFAFHHGPGLGILGTGAEVPKQVRSLLTMRADEAACVHQIYEDLAARAEDLKAPQACP